MGSKERTVLTEAMFYVLMALLHQDMCGTQITEFVQTRTGGRVVLGPGTLYTLLSKFQQEKLICEVAVSGRKRTYRITPLGIQGYREELKRLHNCLSDAIQEDSNALDGALDSFAVPVT